MESSQAIPFVDAHAVTVHATPAATWDALLDVVSASFDRSPVSLVARVLGCQDTHGNGSVLSVLGATAPGFRVAGADPQSRLELVGRHRFSRYKLVFVLEALDGPGCRVRAETWAAFPGGAGRLYRAFVIGSGGHVIVVRSMLAGVRRRASTNRPAHG